MVALAVVGRRLRRRRLVVGHRSAHRRHAAIVGRRQPHAHAVPGPGHRPTRRSPLTVGLGYIPSVQFAQFYLADQAGYYRDAGLDVTLQNKIDPDLITLLGQGAVDIGCGDGTSVIPAVSQGIPVVYTATIYGHVPGGRAWPRRARGIATAADLTGKRIGIPGKYGIVLDHAPGAARVRRPDDGRRDDRRVPGLRPGGGAPAGPGRCGDRLRQQRADPAAATPGSTRSCSASTTSWRCPGPAS